MTCHAAIDRRRRELALIHIGADALGLDEDAYRAMIEKVTDKTSAADLTAAERGKVIEYLKGSGFHPEEKRMGETERRIRRWTREFKAKGYRPQHAYIRALWQHLGALGEFYDPHWESIGIDRFVYSQHGVALLAWLPPNKCNEVIEALKSWIARAERRGKDDDDGND